MRDDDPRAGTIGPIGADGEQGVDGADYTPPKPKRGRPRYAEEPLSPVTVHLPLQAQDRIIRLARQRRQPVSEYLRDVIGSLFGNRS
jgi:hypothetical protein